MKIKRKHIKQKFEEIASKQKNPTLEDELAQSFVKTAIAANCEVAVFLRNPEKSYSTRAMAMSPETLTYQMAKTICSVCKNYGFSPAEFLNGVAAEVLFCIEKEKDDEK